MSSIIHRLALTLPDAATAEPLGEPPYFDVAERVASLIAAGRADELRNFFAALEAAYVGPLDPASSNALGEGLMESLISGLGQAGVSPRDIYGKLLPESRNVWKAHWQYVHDSAWPDL